MDLSGKNVVYVGGFGGIGYVACKNLMLKNVAKLVILDIRYCEDLMKELRLLNPSVKLSYFKVDLFHKESIEQSLKSITDEIEFIDVLVNGSGIVNEKNVELCVGVNLVGVINMTLAAIPLMDKSLKGRGGMILNIASTLGLEPAPPNAVYSATKYGLVGFTRSLMHDYYYQRTGIMMMLFCPSLTITPLLDSSVGTGLTFPYSADVVDTIMNTKSQTADECGTSLVKAIEGGRNGIIWISDGGELKETEIPKCWECHM